jgi:hypothetical protein
MFDRRGAWLAAAAVLAAGGSTLGTTGCARPKVEDSPPLFAAGAGEVERRVPRDAEEAWDAVLRTLRRNGFTPVKTDHDRLGGDVAARRGDVTVFVRVRMLDPDRTLVSARAEPPDPELPRRLQEAFALGLGLGEARAGMFGGCSAELHAGLTLDEAVRRARDVLRDLRIMETGLEQKADEAEVRGRTADSIPVLIVLASSGPAETEATFVVGDRKRDAYRALAERMKNEFERRS